MRGRVVVAIASLCACTPTTRSAIRPDDKVDPRSAYLYGRFFIRADAQGGAYESHQSIGLRLWCADRSQYTIWFSQTRDVQVLKADPSECALVRVSFANASGITTRTVDAAPELRRLQEFAAGRAYYLGDFFARGIVERTQHVGFYEIFQSWAMDPADDRFDATTADMQRTFPNLARLPTTDSRLIRAKPAVKRGAVVITDPKESLMTPERIARVAPFVRRTFGSPAECEAACPTGQCLPFRGEKGPAMTCINRCNSDSDCPSGLACNCPNSEKADGPDCRPIATTPADRLARFCLSVEPAASAPN